MKEKVFFIILKGFDKANQTNLCGSLGYNFNLFNCAPLYHRDPVLDSFIDQLDQKSLSLKKIF